MLELPYYVEKGTVVENKLLADIASYLAMLLVVCSYFTKKKERFLLFQSLCIVFLIVSYFFNVQFFAMVGLAIGLARALVFFAYEKRGRLAPFYWPFLLAGMTLASYFIVNYAILQAADPLDILCLAGLVCYAFIFRIRNLTLVRFLMLVPTVLSILFNILTDAAPGASLTYVFELGANIVSIFKYHVWGKGIFMKKRKKEN